MKKAIKIFAVLASVSFFTACQEDSTMEELGNEFAEPTYEQTFDPVDGGDDDNDGGTGGG